MTTNDSTGTPANGDVPTYDFVNLRWTYAAPPGAVGGEANTIVNDGNGLGLYATKVGVALHLNTLTNTDGYIGIASNASLITFSFLQPDLYQHTNANLTLLQAYPPDTWQHTNAALTALAGNPNLYQATNGNLTLLSAYGPTTWQATNGNLTLLSAYPPDTWQKTNATLTLWQSITPTAKQNTLPTVASNRFWAGLTDGSGGVREVKVTYTNGVTNYWVGDTVFFSANLGNGANISFSTNADGKITIASTGGAGSTNMDYFSANDGVITNTFTVLGPMYLTSLYFGDGTVTNNMQASNVVANVAVITPKVGSTNGASSTIVGVGTTNAITIAGTGVADFLKTPTVAGVPVLTNASGATQTPWISDINGAGYKLTNVTQITGSGSSAGWEVATNLMVDATNFVAVEVIVPRVASTNGAASLLLGVGSTNAVTIAASTAVVDFLHTPKVGAQYIITEDVAAANYVTKTNGTFDVALTGPTLVASSNVVYAAGGAAADYVDLDVGVVEETISGAITLAHATNGAASKLKTAVKIYRNPSGSDQTLTIPSGWNTNAFSAVPTKLTNGWTTVLTLTGYGSTGSSATQTNCYVAFQYYKH